ncbi:3D-(3,5/4)-trihydroxycyclohexane-1,2-dione acylhydrolase (decyclizing) [Mesorhizobium sp. B2-5-13]|uniref:3D-(3,5/4)-trihydroxycyclohexane-1,2-dione acylhydrolase (decyclizing) n=1 Tax=unclassified Mesorhizobium TaxID=325217 RepID=UPI00112659BB|nr:MULTISPECIES: 3D-(3,5/4)-trihydroxycyclohexane-1,2-dione acylhydrolase (decyclizing) [unclassified Mesorhizobium]TPJ35924.1 3D-(3,5/4)-trihydroxycyclohexane-1,2-dione acylhydrolase (decyclizing) [Mesorhizobium sp. B2-6-5]TPJ83232.1 3D-(3,5/4)-trihydroxycyclohexane-1,2-dione acylhydrolase (decyclizing) [Mesorhizobium sp. B2-5-13]TPK42532.1 3D-(3,5/4)-trihydroxycyclohexane-1,2-dione acylhydrolase (decyclizing) [Mesorhizobium sp. B2-5-5]
MSVVRLTMAQALVRYLCNQFTIVDGERVPLFPGVFAIFGHGNVTCLSEALEAVQDRLPTWRGQNEQSMALAAIGFAKAKRRRQIMVAATSIGPGALNMVTAAGVAHSNRLPVLMLSGDTFINRRPDPVMQQVEHFGNPTINVNDAFKAVTRYWDRIVHPEGIISSLPQAVATMLDPADCGPAFIALPQDVQEMAWDYPEEFFAETVHAIPRPRPDANRLAEAVKLLKAAKRPLIISGGGTRYSGAEQVLADLALIHGIPLCETIAGKSTVSHNHPAYVGPIGIVGSTSANALAASADVIIAVGTRLMDFTTGSWSAFATDAKFISINAARWDATKHRALAVVGDALATLSELGQSLAEWQAPREWTEKGRIEFAKWNKALDGYQQPTNQPVPSYAQVIGIVNERAGERDLVITAAGGLPGEVMKNWRVKSPNTFDCEFGFSCMGYEIAAGWGAALADPTRTPIVMIGDGTYMMMNSDIYSTVLSGHKMVVIVCDNGGYAVINRLQNAKGAASFNNLIKDCRVKEPFSVDFVKHAESMGALTRRVDSLADLPQAVDWALGTDRTTVITLVSDGFTWTPGDAWWDVGVPEVSARPQVREAHAEQAQARRKQRVGV